MRIAMIALVASVTTAQAQGLVPYYGPDGQVYYRRAPDPGYAAPGVPPDIIAPERPRGAPRQRNAPIAVAPLEPLSPEPPPPMPRAPTAPIQTEPPNPLIVQAGGKCEGAAVPQYWVSEGAAMMRTRSFAFDAAALLLIAAIALIFRSEGKRLGRPPIAPALEARIRKALAIPGCRWSGFFVVHRLSMQATSFLASAGTWR